MLVCSVGETRARSPRARATGGRVRGWSAVLRCAGLCGAEDERRPAGPGRRERPSDPGSRHRPHGAALATARAPPPRAPLCRRPSGCRANAEAGRSRAVAADRQRFHPIDARSGAGEPRPTIRAAQLALRLQARRWDFRCRGGGFVCVCVCVSGADGVPAPPRAAALGGPGPAWPPWAALSGGGDPSCGAASSPGAEGGPPLEGAPARVGGPRGGGGVPPGGRGAARQRRQRRLFPRFSAPRAE